MVAKSKAGKKQSKVKVGKLKAKGSARNLSSSEIKKVRGGMGWDVKSQKKV